MMNMQNMMKQAQKLQKQMQDAQAELNQTRFTGQSPQELVRVEVSGDKKLQQISFKPEVVDPDDLDTLSDMVIAAMTDAFDQVDTATQQKMGKFANLPF